MKWKIANKLICLRFISAIILAIGFGTAIYLYQTAKDDSNGVLGYEIVDGTAYPIIPEDSKIYRHDLELFGGKAAVLADEFNRWFAGLWHGKSLALILVCVTIIISSGVFFAAKS